MAKYTRQELMELCGCSGAHLTMYTKRNKAIKDEDGLYDTTNPINKEFIVKCQEKLLQPKKNVPVKKPIASPKIKTPKSSPSKNERNATETDGEILQRWDLDKQIKEAELRKKEEEIKKLQAQNAKLNGENIPTELVRIIFKQHFKSVTEKFYQGAENYLSLIQQQSDLGKKQIGELREGLINLVNQSLDEAQELSVKDIDVIVQDYSITRGKGERN